MESTKIKVNLAATRERLARTGRKMAPYALARDINSETLRKFFSGKLPPSEGPVYTKILGVLEEDGLLVEEIKEVAL
jgi:hypothetical protein